MLAEGYRARLKVGIIGLAAATGESVLRSTVTDAPDWQANPLLPDTQGELAVPVKLGDQILGVLDVHSDIPGLLDANDQLMLEGLCGQLAIAIESTRLRQEMEDRLRELSALQRLTTREGWETFLTEQTEPIEGYSFHQGTLEQVTLDELGEGEGEQIEPETAVDSGKVVKPVQVYGHVIGGLGIYDDPDNPLSPEDQILLDSISTQVAESLERARLLEQTKRQAATLENVLRQMQVNLNKTQALYQASRAIGEAKTTQEVVQGAAEICAPLGMFACSLATINDVSGNDAPGKGDFYSARIVDGVVTAKPHLSEIDIWASEAVQQLRDAPGFVEVYADAEDPETPMPDDIRNYLRQSDSRGAIVLGLHGYSKPIGLLAYTSEQPLPDLSKNDIQQTRTIADQVVIALENQRLFAETQKALAEVEEQARRPALLNEMSQELTRAQDEDSIFRTAAERMEQMIQTDMVGTAFLSEDGNHLEIFTFQDGEMIRVTEEHFTLDETLIGAVMEQNRVAITSFLEFTHFGFSPDVAIIPDARESHWADMHWAVRQGINSFVSAPIVIGDEVVGTFNIGSKQPHTYTMADESFIIQVTLLLSSTMENRRLFKQIQDSLKTTEDLYRVTQRIGTAVGLQEVLSVVVEGLSIPDVNRAFLLIFNRDATGQIFTATVAANWHSGEGTPPIPAGKEYAQTELSSIRTFLSSETVISNDVQHNPQVGYATRMLLQEQNTQSMVVLPLSIGPRQLGNLILQSEVPHQFTETEIQPYLSVLPQMVFSVENERLLVEARTALADAEAAQRRYTVRAWESYRQSHRSLHYEQVREGVAPLDGRIVPEVYQAVSRRETIISDGSADGDSHPEGAEDGASLVTPLTLRDEIIGVLGLQETEGTRTWLPEEVAFIEAIATEFAQAAEELRLVDETQRRAAREQLTREITDKMRTIPDLESIIQTGLTELAKALNVPRTYIKLGSKPEQIGQVEDNLMETPEGEDVVGETLSDA
jgi:GAF domain-containing protein